MNVYILTEITKRELDSNLLLACIAADNNFEAQLPDEHVDIIYLCFPNNPTGAVASLGQLKKWVD